MVEENLRTTSTALFSSEETSEEWRELESDPGLFSLLVENYGVRGVTVEEVYDVSTKIQGKVYGYVFLFRYEHGDRRARKKARELASEDVSYVLEPDIINSMFFAHQIIVNSCATHALLSVLLNCPDVQLGHTLTRLKTLSSGLDPESKGFAIANMAELSVAHNKHAQPNVMLPSTGRKGAIVSSAHSLLPETYHFVSYVPINCRLFELDGLKEYPIDHGPWGDHEDWTDLFQRTISCRLAQSENFLFNLMAVIPDPAPQLSIVLKSLCAKQEQLLRETIDWATKTVHFDKKGEDSLSKDIQMDDIKNEDKLLKIEEITKTLPSDMEALGSLAKMDSASGTARDNIKKSIAQVILNAQEMKTSKQKLKEHVETVQRYQIEHSRRIHDYEPFITDFVKMLAQTNKLPYRITKTASMKSVNMGHVRHKSSKRRPLDSHKRPKTTLLVNGTKVD